MAEVSVPELTGRPAATGGVPRALFVACFAGPWSLLCGGLAMLFGALKLPRACCWDFQCWSGGILTVAGVRVEVLRPPPREAGACLFFANHQSALDIPILFQACLPTHDVRFLAKESLFKIPFFGWGMRLSGFIPIRRESARHSAEIFQDLIGSHARERDGNVPPAGGRSYIIFPEGTRSPDGRLRPFKKGAIGFALRLNLPVVPVTLIDACRAHPKSSYRVRAGTVRVIFHETIEVAPDAGRGERDELAARVYAAILSALPEDQRPA